MRIRHSWSPPNRFLYKTERECTHCGLVKVTDHPPTGFPTKSFWRDAEKLDVVHTPPCASQSEHDTPEPAKEAA